MNSTSDYAEWRKEKNRESPLTSDDDNEGIPEYVPDPNDPREKFWAELKGKNLGRDPEMTAADSERYKTSRCCLHLTNPTLTFDVINRLRLHVRDIAGTGLAGMLATDPHKDGARGLLVVYNSTTAREAAAAVLRDKPLAGISVEISIYGRSIKYTVWSFNTVLFFDPPSIETLMQNLFAEMAVPMPRWEARIKEIDNIATGQIFIRIEGKVTIKHEQITFEGQQRKMYVEGNKCLVCDRVGHSSWDCVDGVAAGVTLGPLYNYAAPPKPGNVKPGKYNSPFKPGAPRIAAGSPASSAPGNTPAPNKSGYKVGLPGGKRRDVYPSSGNPVSM